MLVGALAAITGCAAPPPPLEGPCVAADPAPPDRVGVFVRRAPPGHSYALSQAAGVAYSTGRLAEVSTPEGRQGLNRDRETGGYVGLRDARLTLLEALTPAPDRVAQIFDATLAPADGVRLEGLLVLGAMTAPSQMPTVGSARYVGRAALTLTRDGADVTLLGDAVIAARFGTGSVGLFLSALRPAQEVALTAPETLAWSGLKVCAARIVSTGGGGVALLDAIGGAAAVVGPPGAAPGGAARLDARFYGQAADGMPSAVAGAFLIGGDAGVLHGVFMTERE